MKKYRVTIESIFVHLPGAEGRGLYGYYTTYEVMAHDARHALQQTGPKLSRHVLEKGLRVRPTGIFRTRYIVDSLWQPVAEPTLPDFVGGGFVFFRIRPSNALVELAKFLLIRFTKPYLVFSLRPEPFAHPDEKSRS